MRIEVFWRNNVGYYVGNFCTRIIFQVVNGDGPRAAADLGAVAWTLGAAVPVGQLRGVQLLKAEAFSCLKNLSKCSIGSNQE